MDFSISSCISGGPSGISIIIIALSVSLVIIGRYITSHIVLPHLEQ
jgi:hypothetical protein